MFLLDISPHLQIKLVVVAPTHLVLIKKSKGVAKPKLALTAGVYKATKEFKDRYPYWPVMPEKMQLRQLKTKMAVLKKV